MHRTWRKVLLGSLALFCCAAFSPAALAAKAEPKGTLTVAPGSDVINLNPLKAADSFSHYALYLIYDTLFTIGEDLQAKGDLVVKTENPDATTYIFTLREGVTFHDGSPLTAEDVKFTYDYVRNKENGHKFATKFAPIITIEVIDPLHVKFVTKEPYAPLLTTLTIPIAPKHIAEKDLDALNSHPVGSGPYTFVEWKPQERLVLTANTAWWGDGPKIKDIVLRPIAEPTTRVTALETGEIQIADGVPFAQARVLQEKGFVFVAVEPHGYNLFAFNETKKPFDDPRVRRAMTLALNRQEITDFVWYGLNKLVNSPIIQRSWAYNPEVTNYPYDPAKAKELLAEAGYPDGFTVKLYHEADENVKKWVEIAQQQWAAVGIKVELMSKEWGAFFNDITAGKYDLCAWQWIGQSDPDGGMYRMFHSSNFAPHGYNWIFYKNDQVDKLLETGRTVLDPGKRTEAYQEAQKILTDDCVYIYLADYRKSMAMSPKVKGFTYSPYNHLRSLATASLEE